MVQYVRPPSCKGDVAKDALPIGEVAPEADAALALHHHHQALAGGHLALLRGEWGMRHLEREAEDSLLPAQDTHRSEIEWALTWRQSYNPRIRIMIF